MKSSSAKLLAIVALFAATAIPSFAADATLTLSGSIAAKTEISVTTAAAASAIDLTTTQTALNVGTLTLRCNNQTGYTVTATSANGGLKNGTYDTLVYSLAYDGAAVTFGSPFIDSGARSAGIVTKNLTIAYTGSDVLSAGTYSDTITFTIATK